MSWEEQIEGNIEITTGDGQVYTPIYMGVVKEIEYNISEFEFPNVDGTRVERGTPKGARHDIEIIFQGANNIDDAKAFENSSKDKRVWTIEHPIHGRLIAHPIKLKFDFDGLNICRISGTIVETLIDDYPKTFTDPKAKSNENVSLANENLTSSFASIILVPDNIRTLEEITFVAYKSASSKVKSGEQSNEYFNLYKEANSQLGNAISSLVSPIQAVQNFLMYPALFEESVKNKLNILASQLNSLISNFGFLTPNEKKIFENNAGTLMMAIVSTVANPLFEDDYKNADDVLSVLDDLVTIYDLYIETLTGLQTSTGSEIDGYLPDPTTLMNITFAVNYTASQLLNIAVNAKKQRSFVLENDSNIVILTHRLYGLLVDDSTMNEFIRNNNLSMDELIQIPKNKLITYYV